MIGYRVTAWRNQQWWHLIWGEASRAICLSDTDAQCLLQPGLAGCCFAQFFNNFRTTEICLWCVLPSFNQEESQLKTYADVVGFSSVFCYAIVIPLCLLYLYGKQHVVLRASRTTTVAWQHIQQKFCTTITLFVLVNVGFEHKTHKNQEHNILLQVLLFLSLPGYIKSTLIILR